MKISNEHRTTRYPIRQQITVAHIVHYKSSIEQTFSLPHLVSGFKKWFPSSFWTAFTIGP